MMWRPNRRGLLLGAGVTALAGCDQLQRTPAIYDFIGAGEQATMNAQRVALFAQPLAREFKPSDISPNFRTNGSTMPASEEYQRHLSEGFANWRLTIGGLVHNPVAFSLADLRAMNTRTQITRHDCVEGWSAIGQWAGVPLKALLMQAGPLPQARFVVFHCADDMERSLDGSGRYYESIGLFDAFHPQTIMALDLNGKPLPVGNGAPVRLRVERQLGYKQAKFVMSIELTSTLKAFGRGKGGYWEDRGYEWYAGI